MLGYCSLWATVSEERNPSLSPIPQKVPTTTVPIPREGCKSGTLLLHLFLFLATALVGIDICAMRTTSAGEVQLAEILSGIGMLLLVAYLWRVTRGGRGLLMLAIAAGVFLSYYTNSLIPAGALCGTLFAISQGALLLAIQPKEKLALFPLIPILAYALTTLLSMAPVGAVAVLVPYPPMIALALTTRASAEREDGPTRTGVICATSLALGVSMGGMILLSMIRHFGTADLTVILDKAREASMDRMLSVEIPSQLPPETQEFLQETFTYENVKNMVNSLFNLMPALFSVTVMLLSAFCQSFLLSSLKSFGFEESLTPRVKEFRMSTISCVVFLVAYAAVWLDNSVVSTLAGTVAQNVYILLLPGLALAGTIRMTSSAVRKGVRGLGCLFYLVILIPCLLVMVPIIPAILEVIGNLFNAITSKLKVPEDDDPFGPSSGDS